MKKPKTPVQRDLLVKMVPLKDLIPYVDNARIHSEEHVRQIAESIREFGWTNPILVDGDKGIIAGHGRVLAAELLGLDLVPVIELSGMTPQQKIAYVLADNQIALNSGWDEDKLAHEVQELTGKGFDLHATGLPEWRVQALLDRDWPDGPPVDDPGETTQTETPVIRVRCQASVKNRIAELLTAAIAEAGIEGATVEC